MSKTVECFEAASQMPAFLKETQEMGRLARELISGFDIKDNSGVLVPSGNLRVMPCLPSIRRFPVPSFFIYPPGLTLWRYHLYGWEGVRYQGDNFETGKVEV